MSSTPTSPEELARHRHDGVALSAEEQVIEILGDSHVFHMKRLISRLYDFHTGTDADWETTMALVFEHMHSEHQRGLRDAHEIVSRIAAVRTTSRDLRIVAEALADLIRRNEAGYETFMASEGATP